MPHALRAWSSSNVHCRRPNSLGRHPIEQKFSVSDVMAAAAESCYLQDNLDFGVAMVSRTLFLAALRIASGIY
jgi:hypothetical protein